MVKTVDQMIEKLEKALENLKTNAQGRVFNVGTKITYNGKFGVVTDLNKDATDPVGSTVDIRLEDGTVVEKVSVKSSGLKLFRQ